MLVADSGNAAIRTVCHYCLARAALHASMRRCHTHSFPVFQPQVNLLNYVVTTPYGSPPEKGVDLNTNDG
jgi:hypothetical protein